VSFQEFEQQYSKKLTAEEQKYLKAFNYNANTGVYSVPVNLLYERGNLDNISYKTDDSQRYAVGTETMDLWKVWFVAQSPVYELKHTDEMGRVQTMHVDGNYVLNPDNGDIEINKIWIPKVYECERFGAEHSGIYTKPEPCLVQRYDKRSNTVKIPIGGKKGLLRGLPINPIPLRLKDYAIVDRILLLAIERAIAKFRPDLLIIPQVVLNKDKAGSTQEKYRSFDMQSSDLDLPPAMNAWQKFATKSSDFLRKYSGRDLSDKIEGSFFHALGETLAMKEAATGKSGDFLKKFGTIVDPDKIANPKLLTPEDIQMIAQDFTSNIRGSYDARTLPTLAMRGQIAPFLSLSRWGVSKANVHMRDILGPIQRDNNWMPLLKTLGAALGTGAAIETLNEYLSGKRPQDPNMKEVSQAPTAGNVTEKLADLLQLAGFMGIVMDTTKLAIRGSRGKDITYSNPLSFPAYTLVTDTLAKNIGQASNALQDGEDPFDTLTKLVVNIAAGSSQNMRVLRNYANADETTRKNFFRDYRVWQELTDRSSGEAGFAKSNEFENMEAKKFKREKDVAKAAGMVGGLVTKAIEDSTVGGTLQPERLKKNLTSLKMNSYQTMPDFENYPNDFYEYYSYLQKTQGEEAAKNRLMDFVLTREGNAAKNEMIPSL